MRDFYDRDKADLGGEGDAPGVRQEARADSALLRRSGSADRIEPVERAQRRSGFGVPESPREPARRLLDRREWNEVPRQPGRSSQATR